MVKYPKNFSGPKLKIFINSLSHKDQVRLGLACTISLGNNYISKETINGIESWFKTDILNYTGNLYNVHRMIVEPENSESLLFNYIGLHFVKPVKLFMATTNYNNKYWNNFIND